MKNTIALVLLAIMVLPFECHSLMAQEKSAVQPITVKRSTDTEALFRNLKKLVDNGQFMFGQANPTTISYLGGIAKTNISQSDCKDITGSHPAFYESDFMWYSQNSEFMQRDLQAMREAYARGAVLGYCWHIRGKNSQSFYAKVDGKATSDKHLVKNILANPNRVENPSLDWLLTQLDTLVIPVFKELGFPLVFRPWHEMNGNWFFWGRNNCSPKEYIELYRLTVNYIRSKGVDNILYCWSPDKSAAMHYYPGDEYVDVLGMDIYEPGIMAYSAYPKMLKELGILTDYAYANGKVAAITETGCRKTDDGQFRYPDVYPYFWTENVLEPFLSDAKTKRVAWIMSWYGANWRGDRSTEAYIPYVGMYRPRSDEAVADFVKFFNHPASLFENDLPKMYE
jgi:mannan endo-1,4-beta-mannosidase